MRFKSLLFFALILLTQMSVVLPNAVYGEFLGVSFFFGTVNRYSNTGDVTGVFVTPDAALFPGLAGVAVNPLNNQVFVSGNNSNSIYVFDGLTGSLITGTPTGIDGVFLNPSVTSNLSAPAGLAFDSQGRLFVANNGGNSVSVFNANGTLAQTIDGITGSNGLTFDSNGDLLVTTTAGNVLRYDGNAVTTFATPGANGPIVANGVLADSQGNVYVGQVFGNSVLKYDSTGTEIVGPGGVAWATPNLPAPTVPPSFPFSAPGGLTFDENGNIVVAMLGSTNPGDGELNGALARYAPDGTFLGFIATKIAPISAVALAPVAVPEPASLALVTLGIVGLGLRGWRRRA